MFYLIIWLLSKNSCEILVNWYGFLDDESGIFYYYFIVGKIYSDFKLFDGVIKIDGNRINILILVNVIIFNLNEVVFIIIWVVNRVRLISLFFKVIVIVD